VLPASSPPAAAAPAAQPDTITPVPSNPIPSDEKQTITATTTDATSNGNDPLGFGQHRRENVNSKQMKIDHPEADRKRMKKFYNRQNQLIDQFLGSGDEERLAALDVSQNGPKIRFAVNASFLVNFFLFIIQMYAAISTGSLSLFATAADAFMDLVSSVVMLITSRMAARPSIYKYPVGRTRIETIGIIMFCCLMTTVAIQLIVSRYQTISFCPNDKLLILYDRSSPPAH